MPSPLELLEGGGHLDPPPPPSDDLLRSVRAEGGRRRTSRHRRNAALALLGLVLLAVPAATLRNGDDRRQRELTVAADGGGMTVPDVTAEPVLPPTADPVAPVTTHPAPPQDATAPVTAAPPLPAAPSTSAAPSGPGGPSAPPAAVSPVTPTSAMVCRNSADPACGPFRWDPEPAPNQPLVASFTKAPATGVAGEAATFEVAWSDADAQLTFDHLTTDGTALGSACALTPRFGPWTPPAATGGSGTLPYTTTFANPGTYRVTVSLGTASCASPYGSDKVVETSITISPGVKTR